MGVFVLNEKEEVPGWVLKPNIEHIDENEIKQEEFYSNG